MIFMTQLQLTMGGLNYRDQERIYSHHISGLNNGLLANHIYVESNPESFYYEDKKNANNFIVCWQLNLAHLNTIAYLIIK